MIGSCLFCNREEGHGYRPSKDIEFVCSRCVQLFLSAEQMDLKRAHKKAIDKGFLNKVKAIEAFLEGEGNDEQRKPTTKKRGRHPNRKRTYRTVGNQKERFRRIEI